MRIKPLIFPTRVNTCLIRPANLSELPSWSVYTIQGRKGVATAQLDLIDFLSFLANASVLRRLPLSKRHLLWRKRLFAPDSTIHRICSIPANYSAWSTDRIPVYTRLAALMHINAALWEYRGSPALHDSYLENLDRIIVENDFATSLSIGFFYYNMMKLDYDEADQNSKASSPTSDVNATEPEKRSWFVTRILRVCKLLGKESMSFVHKALLGFLDPSSTGSMDGLAFDRDWIERLRREIIASDTDSAVSSTTASPSDA
jgi:hypothetical protein